MKHPNSSKLASSYLAPLLKLCWGKATYIRNDGFGNLHLIYSHLWIFWWFFFQSSIQKLKPIWLWRQGVKIFHSTFFVHTDHLASNLLQSQHCWHLMVFYRDMIRKKFLLFVSGCAFRVQSDDNLNEWRGQPYPLAVVQQSKKVAAWQWLVLHRRQSSKWKIMLHVLNHILVRDT